jgi:hypothetical protein
MRGAALAVMSCLFVACGSSGYDGPVDAPPEEPPVQGPTGVVQQAVTLTGTLHLGDTATPAAGYELWILDHSDGGMGRFPVGAAGEITVPLSIFRVDHRYSFHVVKGDRLLGDLDFGDSTDGAQSTLVYDGGYGFDLGDIIANVTSRGDVDIDDPGLGAEVGGGFSLDVDSTATFATLPPPDGVESFHFKSQLAVFDPISLLYDFYRRDANPARYAEALLEQSRVVVSLSTRSKDTVSRLSAFEGGQWLDASRLGANDADARRGEAPLWSASGHMVPEVDGMSFLASVYTGALLAGNSFALFRVQPESGASLTVPRLLGRVYAVPPMPTAIALEQAGNRLSPSDPSALAARYVARQSWPLVGDFLHMFWTVAEHLNDDGDLRSAKLMWQVLRDKGPIGAPETQFAKARLDPTRTELEKMWD